MTSSPSGRLVPTDDGTDLVLSRTFRAPLEDVWASVTDPEHTARWFGPWVGEPGAGAVIKVQMVHEEQTPWFDARIDACDPPHRLAISVMDSVGWRLELLLSHTDGRTELRLVHHLDTLDGIGEVGPGWEYYLDGLAAARDGSPAPRFDDYYPAMKPYFDALDHGEVRG